MKHKKRSANFPTVSNQAGYCYANDKKKRKYATKLDAELFAPSKNLQQYVCEYCEYWHNGTPSARIKRA
jgi:hypothetical protein